jgi:Rap1-interacting factor 1 N terminal.
MVKLVGVIPDWRPSWCLILDILGGELVKRGNNHLINKLLSVLERAFKHERSEVRDEAFVSWRHLIDRLLPPSLEVWEINLFSHSFFV